MQCSLLMRQILVILEKVSQANGCLRHLPRVL
jgi:hypothetical protein